MLWRSNPTISETTKSSWLTILCLRTTSRTSPDRFRAQAKRQPRPSVPNSTLDLCGRSTLGLGTCWAVSPPSSTLTLLGTLDHDPTREHRPSRDWFFPSLLYPETERIQADASGCRATNESRLSNTHAGFAEAVDTQRQRAWRLVLNDKRYQRAARRRESKCPRRSLPTRMGRWRPGRKRACWWWCPRLPRIGPTR